MRKIFSEVVKKVMILRAMLGIGMDTPTTRHPLLSTKLIRSPGHVNPGELLRSYGKPGTFFSVCVKALGSTQNSLSGFRGGDISPCSFSDVFSVTQGAQHQPAEGPEH